VWWVQVFWPKVVLKKWLNLRSKDYKFNADEDDDDGDVNGEQGRLSDQASGLNFGGQSSLLTLLFRSLVQKRTAAATAARWTAAWTSPVSLCFRF
jgi:hypothetical protein